MAEWQRLAPRNRAKQHMLDGGIALGMQIRMIPTVDVIAVAAAAGFDAVNIDLEHSSLSLETASQLCCSAHGYGITPLIRVPSHQPHDIGRCLDAGALGIIVPHVDTAAQAAQVVDAAKYPPTGHRSVAGAMPQLAYAPAPAAEGRAWIETESLIICMVETLESVANAAEIAAVPGIDMLFVGSVDLASSIPGPAAEQAAQVDDALLRVAEACRNSGKFFGIGGSAGNSDRLRASVEAGARYISAGSDYALLAGGARERAATLRALGRQPERQSS